MTRVHNFSAGPAALPAAVLERASAEMLDYAGTGMSVMEMSHRSKGWVERQKQWRPNFAHSPIFRTTTKCSFSKAVQQRSLPWFHKTY